MRATVIRTAVIGILLVALMPAGARAEHCSEIRVLSGTGLLLHTGAIGCAGGSDVDTDYINPGSTQIAIRVFGAESPTRDSTFAFAGVVAGGGCVAGQSCPLTQWTRGADAVGEPPGPYWDSRVLSITRASSIDGGEAVATICFDTEPAHCESRAYRTAR